MSFTISKIKAALNAKAKSHKNLMDHKVTLTAIAATAPKDLKLERRQTKTLKGLKRRERKTVTSQLERVTNGFRAHGQNIPILTGASGDIINVV